MSNKELLLIGCMFVLLPACREQDEIENGAPRPMQVAVTGVVIRNTVNYVDITGRVNLDLLDENLRSTAVYGIEISLYSEFYDYNSPRHQPISESNGLFLCRFVRLKPNKQYWYRTYVQVGDKVYYGKRAPVTTLDNPLIPLHPYVDLGLSDGTLWATCNIGAEEPYEDGMFFAWGEVAEKNEYNVSTYSWYGFCRSERVGDYGWTDIYGYTKYTSQDPFLMPEDDAAAVLWGDGWEIPTKEQFEILLKETDHEFKKYDGVWGVMLESKQNKNILFLPAASQKIRIANQSNDRYGMKEDCKGFYRTNELYCPSDGSPSDDAYVYCLYFDAGKCEVSPGQERLTGMPVRPVRHSDE